MLSRILVSLRSQLGPSRCSTMAPYGLSPEVGRNRSSVVAELVCPASARMTRTTSPIPAKWTIGCQLGNVARCVLESPEWAELCGRILTSDVFMMKSITGCNRWYLCVCDMLIPVYVHDSALACGMPPTFFRHMKVMSKFLQRITKRTSQANLGRPTQLKDLVAP